MTQPAALPEDDFPGLDRRFRRTLAVPGRGADTGTTRTWHYLDTGDALAAAGVTPVGVILAVHGNPTWCYHWRDLANESVRAAEAGESAWRVVAVDQLEMGFSERSGTRRPLAQRVQDLGGFTDALGLTAAVGPTHPIVGLGHDWGGVVSLGWAVDHPEHLAAIALLNTAVHRPEGTSIPWPLRVAGARGALSLSTIHTSAFLDLTLSLASPPLSPAVKAAYRAPYRTAERRDGIGGFVADIPVDATHESFAELARIGAGVATLEVPALLQWGPEDPIFSERYLHDLMARMPQADVHRFEGAGHLIAEERPYADALLGWLTDNRRAIQGDTGADAPEHHAHRTAGAEPFTPLWHRLDERRDDDAIAVVDMSHRVHGEPIRVSWRQLADKIMALARGLRRRGVRPGTRVSLLIPPGPTLTAAVYACLRIGAVLVIADAGLGVRGLTRAVRGARADVIIGETPGLAAARMLAWPGRRISASRLPRMTAIALGVDACLADLVPLGGDGPTAGPSADPGTAADPPAPGADDDAAILFTSGSTGPAKGVVYTHAQLSALRDGLAAHFGIRDDTGLVTGFAPFALLGPALGTCSTTPDMDVSSPRTLTARAVADAVHESAGSVVFLSPAAILNVVATADALTEAQRRALTTVDTFLSTGAPVSPGLLEAAGRLMPRATPHTPYGMTECLLVTDVTLDETRAAGDTTDAGVCVGRPIGAALVRISALDADGRAVGTPSDAPGVLGEIVISAPHLKSHYDRLWLTDREAVRATGGDGRRWHRTGDVGHLDADGRLWVEGRMPHVIVGAQGPIAPVGGEQQLELVPTVRRAAVVGVGPQGLRQPVAVLETQPGARRASLADPGLTAQVRESTDLPLAAVLVVKALPTDIRHNSKIDRTRLSVWADRVLSGSTPGAP